MSEKESAGLREALAELAAKWRKRVEPLRNLGESNQIVCGWVEECAYELEAALAPAISRPPGVVTAAKDMSAAALESGASAELAISRPPTQGPPVIPLVNRHGLFTSADFPCPYCKQPAYLAAMGGGKSTGRHIRFAHVTGSDDCLRAAVEKTPSASPGSKRE